MRSVQRHTVITPQVRKTLTSLANALELPEYKVTRLASGVLDELAKARLNKGQLTRVQEVLNKILNAAGKKTADPKTLTTTNITHHIALSHLKDGTVFRIRVTEKKSIFFSLKVGKKGDVKGFVYLSDNLDRKKALTSIRSLNETLFHDEKPIDEAKILSLPSLDNGKKLSFKPNDGLSSSDNGLTFESALLSILYKFNQYHQ